MIGMLMGDKNGADILWGFSNGGECAFNCAAAHTRVH